MGKTFMNPEYSPPEEIYLFIRDIRVDKQEICHIPKFFWGIDRKGNSRLTEVEVERYLDIIPEDPVLSLSWYRFSWPSYVYESLLEIQKAHGFNPETDAFANYLGITDEIDIEPSELRFSEEGT